MCSGISHFEISPQFQQYPIFQCHKSQLVTVTGISTTTVTLSQESLWEANINATKSSYQNWHKSWHFSTISIWQRVPTSLSLYSDERRKCKRSGMVNSMGRVYSSIHQLSSTNPPHHWAEDEIFAIPRVSTSVMQNVGFMRHEKKLPRMCQHISNKQKGQLLHLQPFRCGTVPPGCIRCDDECAKRDGKSGKDGYWFATIRKWQHNNDNNA